MSFVMFLVLFQLMLSFFFYWFADSCFIMNWWSQLFLGSFQWTLCQFRFWYPATMVQVILSLSSLPCICTNTCLCSYKTWFLCYWPFDHLQISQIRTQNSTRKIHVPRLCTKPFCLQKCQTRWEATSAIPVQDHVFVQGLKHMVSAVWLNAAARKFGTKATTLTLTSFHRAKEN